MLGGQRNPLLIQLLVNYWEIQSSKLGEHMDELVRRGVRHVTTFLPWQAMESDISHSLTRFLQAVIARKMTASLILTPEVGVNYPCCGLPKDIWSRPENLAQHFQKGPVMVQLPPSVFALPALLSSEFEKRYFGFLSRIDTFLGEFSRTCGQDAKRIELILTGSYWKYYRSARASQLRAYGGTAGDFSSGPMLSYAQKLEQFFSQKEFAETTPFAASRWKTRGLDEVNRKWFFQYSEAAYRYKTFQAVRRKCSSLRLREMELYTPEADPAMSYSEFLRMATGGPPDFAKLSSILDESASRATFGSLGIASPYFHLTSIGAFSELGDSQKLFLILKAVLLAGSQGGGILIDEREWFKLPTSHRARAENLARTIHGDGLQSREKVLYLVPHVWSTNSAIWDAISESAGTSARIIGAFDPTLYGDRARVVFVDPTCIVTRELLEKLHRWAQTGKLVVLPRSPLFTESAREELEKILGLNRSMEIDLGVRYRVFPIGEQGEGNLVVYDGSESIPQSGQFASAWKRFVQAMLSMGGVARDCTFNMDFLSSVSLEAQGQATSVFILNSSKNPVPAEIQFDPGASQPRSLSVEVPPLGILPLSVSAVRPELSQLPEISEKNEAFMPGTLFCDEAHMPEGTWS